MSITVQGVSKIYGKQKALNNVSFEIQPGEIVGFLGPNGAGKSTMMKIITGYLPATSGQVRVLDKSVQEDDAQIKRQIGYLPEHNPLYLEMYVWEFLTFIANLNKVPNAQTRIKEVIAQVGLEKEQNKIIESLSKGYRQRVGLAHALLHDPQILILDEPTTGLDPNQIVEIRNLIKRIGANKTVMLSTHIMQEVQAVCSRVIIINNGEIVANEAIDQISQVNEKYKVVKVQFDGLVDLQKLKNLKGAKKVVEQSNHQYEIHSNFDTDLRPLIFEFAVNAQVAILEIALLERQLEDVFHDLTEKK